MHRKILGLLLVVSSLVFVSCRSHQPATSSSIAIENTSNHEQVAQEPPPGATPSSVAAEDTIPFCTGPIDPRPPTYIGHIVATNSLDPSQTIRVQVLGCVNMPGWITAPKGITALGAIKRAGGFVSIGASRYLRIVRDDATCQYMLAKEPLVPEVPGHYRIWYGPYEWSDARRRNLMDEQVRSDVVLENKDIVLVPAVL